MSAIDEQAVLHSWTFQKLAVYNRDDTSQSSDVLKQLIRLMLEGTVHSSDMRREMRESCPLLCSDMLVAGVEVTTRIKEARLADGIREREQLLTQSVAAICEQARCLRTEADFTDFKASFRDACEQYVQLGWYSEIVDIVMDVNLHLHESPYARTRSDVRAHTIGVGGGRTSIHFVGGAGGGASLGRRTPGGRSSLRGSLHGHGTATQQGFDNPPQRDRLDPFEEVCVNQVLELVNKLIDVYDGTHVDPNIARLDRPGQRVNLDRQISLLFTRIEQEPHPQFHYELVDRLWRKSKASHYALQRLVKLNMVQVESVLQEHISREASVQNASVQNVEQTRATETLSRYYREHQFFGKAADFMLYMARRPPPPSINEEYDGNSLSPDFAITARLDFFGQCDGSLKQSYRTEAQGAHATVDKHKLRSYFELAKIQWDLYSDLMKDHEDGNHQINPSDEMKRDEHTAGRFAHMIIVDICDRDQRQMRKDYTDLVDR